MIVKYWKVKSNFNLRFWWDLQLQKKVIVCKIATDAEGKFYDELLQSCNYFIPNLHFTAQKNEVFYSGSHDLWKCGLGHIYWRNP